MNSEPRTVAMVVGVAMVLVGVVWLVEDDDLDGAEDAVRAYVAHIANGDAAAANSTVDPRRFENVDPVLLTDRVLDAASERIEVTEVTATPDRPVHPDGKAEVGVRYRLAGQTHDAVLVAQRDNGVLGFGRQWRVSTPLTVPVAVGYSRPGVGQARIGPVAVPVEDAPRGDRPLHVYPGTYAVAADPSKYFTAAEVTVPLAVDSEIALPSEFAEEGVVLEYQPNERLRTEAGKVALDLLDACLVNSPDVAEDDCPYPTRSDATEVRLTAAPVVSIDDFQFTDRRAPDDLTNPIGLVTEFPVAYTTDDGMRLRETRTLYGMIHIDADDGALSIDFSS